MSSVILVGNGTSVLDREQGSQIDSFDLVVRFNSFQIKGFEKYVGTKTDIWYTCLFCPHRAKQKYQQIVEHTWEWNKEKDRTYQKFVKHGLYPQKTRKNDVLEISSLVGIPEYTTYSTGAIAINRLLKNYPLLTLIGFDWWERQKHHYGDTQTRGHNHKPEIEKKYIDLLVSQQKIRFLSSY